MCMNVYMIKVPSRANMENKMPKGFRFYPTEEELICFYLTDKLQNNNTNIDRVIPLIDIYKLDPWHLPKHCGELCRGDTEQWFFFMPKQERQVHGGKPSRTTTSGYWKATGSLSHVYSSDSKIIGVKKTMVFYKGKAPTGTKTKWKMNEYRAIKPDLETSIPKLRDEVSVCRIYIVSGSLRAFDRRPVHGAETAYASMDESVKINEKNHSLSAEENAAETITNSGTSISGGNCCIDEENGVDMMIDEWLGNLIESEPME